MPRKRQRRRVETESEDDGEFAAEDAENTKDEEDRKPSAAPLRRSSRRRNATRKSLNLSDEQESEQEEEDPPGIDEDEYKEEEKEEAVAVDVAKAEADAEEEAPIDGAKATTVEPKSSSGKSGRKKPKKQKATTMECPHCSKKFQSPKGYHYHVDNLVCQTEAPVKGKRKRPPPSDGDEGNATRKTYKRIRGKAEDRTCPRCSRVFTSVLGLNYHLEKRVCEKAEIKETPFPTLATGTRLLSPFGVVEVVRDDRATPVATFPDKLKPLLRQYHAFKAKREARIEKAREGYHTIHLMQRKKLTNLFERESIGTRTIFSVYYRKDPREITQHVKRPVPDPDRPDPSVPAESFPDRIVECVLVPDDRSRYTGGTGSSECTEIPKSYELAPTQKLVRLFLRRQTLTEIYSENAQVFICATCGTSFGSKSGWMHHTTNTSCSERAEATKAQNAERMKVVETRAVRYQKKGTPKPKEAGSSGTEKATVAVSSSGAVAQTFEAKPAPAASDADLAKTAFCDLAQEDLAAAPRVLTKKQAKQMYEPSDKFVDPRVTLQNIEDEIHQYQSRMLGTMYRSVFNWLKFKKAAIPKKKKKKKKTIIKRVIKQVVVKKKKRKKPAPKAKKPPPRAEAPSDANSSRKVFVPSTGHNFDDLPPIIDMRVLIAEVNNGRYPSLKRHKGDVKHESKCAIYMCRDPSRGPLVLCGFCTNVFHLNCLLQKFTVKEPEPGDAIMCHNCIQYVMAMRTRAEKRRLEKQGIEDPVINVYKKQEVVKETKGTIEGHEYECVLAQGKRAADIVEMLGETRTRLEQAVHTSKANSARRAAILQLHNLSTTSGNSTSEEVDGSSS